MKKIIYLLLLLLLISTNTFSQKIQVKKSTFLLDKFPIALVEGKLSAFTKADLTIKSLDGNPLMTIKEGYYNYFNPFLPDLRWLEIKFTASGNTFWAEAKGGRYSSEREIGEVLFVQWKPAILKDNKIDPEAENSVISQLDCRERFIKDTTDKLGFERGLRKVLKTTRIRRDLTKPLVVKRIAGPADMNSFEIYQDEKLLGRISEYNERQGIEWITYVLVEKKLVPAFQFQDQSYDFGLLAYKQISVEDYDYTTHQDNMLHDELRKVPMELIPLKFAEALVANGYL